jgi:hypothetical protein
LGECVDILHGYRSSDRVNLLLPAKETTKGVAVIEDQNITLDNKLNHHDTRYRIIEKSTETYQLQPNDLCIRSTIASDNRMKVAEIYDDVLPLAVSDSVLILRVKSGKNVDIDFLAAYLQSNAAVLALRAQGIAERLYPNALAEVLVPEADEELRSAINGLRKAARAHGTWQNEADTALQGLFDTTSAAAARKRLLTAG